jgi:hypothetical protein
MLNTCNLKAKISTQNTRKQINIQKINAQKQKYNLVHSK